MSNYLVYINLPDIPEHLLEPIIDIINKPAKKNYQHYFETRYVSTELDQWIQNTLQRECYCTYQIVRNGIPIHKDVGRDVAFNYIIDAGGSNVLTCFYDEDRNLVYSEKIHEKKWHRINTSLFHNVCNIETTRVAFSMQIQNYNWNDIVFGPA